MIQTSMSSMRRVTITLPADLVTAADRLAKRLGRSRSRLIAEGLQVRVQGTPVAGSHSPMPGSPGAVAEPVPAPYAGRPAGALRQATDAELLEELQRRLGATAGEPVLPHSSGAEARANRPALAFDRQRLAEICLRHHIRRLSLFGSMLRSDFGPTSDVDVLVEFEPGKTPGLAIVDIEEELSALFGGRRVDLATPNSLHRLIRDQVLAGAAVQYAA